MDRLEEERQLFWVRRHPPNTQDSECRRPAIFPVGIPANPNIAGLTSIIFPEGIPDPSVRSYFLGIQRAIRRDLTLEANYVGTSGSHLIRAENVNRIPGGLLPEGTCVRDNLGRYAVQPTRHWAQSVRATQQPVWATQSKFRRSAGMARHRRLKLQLAAAFAEGQAGQRAATFDANYTFSHSIDSGSSWHNMATSVNGFAAGDGYTTDQTLPGLDRGNSTYDVRHRLTVSYIWELPFF